MDTPTPTSFIPKKPLTQLNRTGGAAFGNLFLLIAALLFVISLVAAGAAFGYQSYLHSAINQESDSLQKAEAAFDSGTIEDLSRLDARINNAELLLQKHVAASAVFAFLGNQTLQNVQLTKFDYEFQTDGGAAIDISGVADNFSTLALQSDQLNANKMLKDVVFSGIVVGTDGKINFDVKASIDPALVSYVKNMTNPQPSIAPATQTVGTTTSSSTTSL